MCHKCVKSDISDRFLIVFQIKQWQFSNTFTKCDTFLMHFQIFSYLFLTDISIWQFFDRILTHSDTKSPFYIWFGCKHSCIIGTISMNMHVWIINTSWPLAAAYDARHLVPTFIRVVWKIDGNSANELIYVTHISLFNILSLFTLLKI